MSKCSKVILSVVLSGILLCSPVFAEAPTTKWKTSEAKVLNGSGTVVGFNNNDQILVQQNSGRPYIIDSDSKTISIDGLGGTNVITNSINDNGQVVGYSNFADGSMSHDAFLWDNGKSIDLGRLAGSYSEARDINNLGQVVGVTDTDGDRREACLWDNGKIIMLGTLDGESSEAVAINDKGQIIGNVFYKDGTVRAFLWENGTMKKLEIFKGISTCEAVDINSNGEIVGTYFDYLKDSSGNNICISTIHVLLWSNNGIQDLGRGLLDVAKGKSINDNGFITGNMITNRFTSGGLWYRDELLCELDDFTECFINNKNHLAGNKYVFGEYNHIVLCNLVNYLFGDVNCDGKVNSKDVSLFKRALLEDSVGTLNNADLNNDGGINSADYSLLKRIVLKQE